MERNQQTMAKDTANQQELTRTVSATQLGMETGTDITAAEMLTKEEKHLMAEKEVPFLIIDSQRVQSEYEPTSDASTGYWWAFTVQIGQIQRVLSMSENVYNQALYDGIAQYTVQKIQVGPWRLQEIGGKKGTWYRLMRHEALDPDAGMSFDVMVEDALIKAQLALPQIQG